MGDPGQGTLPGVVAPYWMRLVREGDVFTASASVDGVAWVEVGIATIPMATNVYVGLALTSHSDGVLATADFDNVSAR